MSIAVRQVTKRFDNGFVAVDNVSLAIAERLADRPARARAAAASPPCSGSSPGSRTPDEGERLDPRPGRRRASRRRSASVGFVFQHYAAFKHMTVRDNVGFGLRSASGRRPRSAARVDELLGLVQLDGFADRYPAPALGRPAPADGPCARARGRAEGAPARRAVRRARRARAQGAADLAPPPARRGSRHDRARHARPGGGDGRRRPRHRHERRPRSSRAASRATSTSTPRTSSS